MSRIKDYLPARTVRSPAAAPSTRREFRLHPLVLLTCAAVTLRVIVLLGRGDYVAFDEGWYLLLARNLFDGDGYSLSGLRHTTLSPLFPLLAGAVAQTMQTVWAGRLVAAVAAGLLVVPCWFIFRRISGRRVATTACVFVAVLPALAPFAAPYWIGWDLWVGAEPVHHLFLYSALALVLRAWQQQGFVHWVLAGCAFALAYLARSEAILPFVIISAVLVAAAVVRRQGRSLASIVVFAASFSIVSAPYWLYLHETLDRWAITGRVIEVSAVRNTAPSDGGSGLSGIERMLWHNDEAPYVAVLYGLDPTGTRLASSYWGVPATDSAPAPAPPDPSPEQLIPSPELPDGAAPVETPVPTSSRRAIFGRALATIIPWYLWPFIALGVLAGPRRWTPEILVTAPLLLTSAAIAWMVAADPRTQLFLLPLAAHYTARGVSSLSTFLSRRLSSDVRTRFLRTGVTVVLATALVSTSARWVYLGVTLGSPHHLVGSANAVIGRTLQSIIPPDQPLMSWHPAIALYAQRDWQVLPQASFPEIVRYANAVGCEYIVISTYYPRPQVFNDMMREHLLIHVPPGIDASAGEWRLHISDRDGYLLGELRTPLSGDAESGISVIG